MDAYGHVNNAVYLNYLEECRDRLVDQLFGSQEAWDFVLVHVGHRLPPPAHAGRRQRHGALRGVGFRPVERAHDRTDREDGRHGRGRGGVGRSCRAIQTPSEPRRSRTERERAALQAAIEAARTSGRGVARA